jgi:hypothetical protein
MASAGENVTKNSIIQDFISAVMNPALFSNRYSTTTGLPTTNQQMWDNGGIRTSYQQPIYSTAYDGYGNPYQYISGYYTVNVSLSCINTAVLDSHLAGLQNPSTGDLPSSAIVASEIISTCRSYAYETSRIRKIQYGLYYTQYSYGQYFGSGVPASGPPTQQIPVYQTGYDNYGNSYQYIAYYISGGPVYTGELNGGTALGHLTASYKVALPSNVGGEPSAGSTISSSSLSSFYSNLRYYANPDTNNSPTMDLRICHTSCHNNCHSARGRR